MRGRSDPWWVCMLLTQSACANAAFIDAVPQDAALQEDSDAPTSLDTSPGIDATPWEARPIQHDASETGDSLAAACMNFEEDLTDEYGSCYVSNNCVPAAHQVDCCGSIEIVGVNREQLAAFQAAEAACVPSSPAGCGCVPGSTLAQDQRVVQSNSTVGVRCVNRTCLTMVL